MKYYLGIDGGGTKTTACVADETGEVLYTATGKTINFYGAELSACRDNLKEILCKIEDNTGITHFDGVFIGCSALDDKASDETIASLCDGVINAEKIGMDSDLFIALKASLGNCVAICGTGSMAIGKKADGKLVTKGGWGHILGDEGSAYAIALTALKKCCSMSDEGVSSPLIDEANKYFNTDNLREIIDIVYSPNTSKAFIAGFAAFVGVLSENGNETAKEIIINQASAFTEPVCALINELDEAPHLSLYGGVFEKNKLFKTFFCNELNKKYPHIIIDTLSGNACEGALKAAMEL